MLEKSIEFEFAAPEEKEPPSCSLRSKEFYKKFFPGSTEKDWTDWKWQLKSRITTIEDLKRFIGENKYVSESACGKFQFGITPYVFSLIEKFTPEDPIFKMYIPSEEENTTLHGCDDPLGEQEFMPVKNLIHRYKDRALLLTTSFCLNLCRYCTRKRMVGDCGHTVSEKELKDCREYIIAHPEIKDLVLSGGDMLTLSTEKINQIISYFYDIESLDVIRIGSKVPNVSPQRFNDPGLIEVLEKYSDKLWINTHFNHPNEITIESEKACRRIVKCGIVLQNQSVLLSGVSDNPEVYMELCLKLVKIKVKPYYLFYLDYVNGVEHFRTPIKSGVDIIEHLRGHITGFAIPNFVVDLPDHGGKTVLVPDPIVEKTDTSITFKSFEGRKIKIDI